MLGARLVAELISDIADTTNVLGGAERTVGQITDHALVSVGGQREPFAALNTVVIEGARGAPVDLAEGAQVVGQRRPSDAFGTDVGFSAHAAVGDFAGDALALVLR